MIEFHNPEAAAGVEPIPYDLALQIRGESPEIGLLANGFPDSESFLTHLGEALQNLAPDLQVTNFNKGNPTMPAGEDLLEGIRSTCAGVIAAYGH